jgi:ribonuclease R
MNKEDVSELFKKSGKPLKFNEIAQKLAVSTGKERSKLKRILRNLIKKGEIHVTKNNTYCYSSEANLIKGTIDFAQGGFAFLIPDETYKCEDIFLKPGTLFEALNGDRALVRIDKFIKNKQPEGTVVKILERSKKEVVGIFEKSKGFAFVTPVDKKMLRDFYIPKGKFKKAATGDMVLIKITRYPTKNQNPVGEVIKVLGKPDEDSTFFSAVNIKYGVREEFPSKVLKKADELLLKQSNIAKKRRDLRNINFFTIDGEKARDFDDAVALEKCKNGNTKLYVSIADVEYYVKDKDAIDKEAYLRATSVYYPHTVYPMLPEVLSNNLCSLNPFEDKFTFTVEMEIDSSGEVVNNKIYKSVIKSHFRATYEEVDSVLNNASEKLNEKYTPIIKDIFLMCELAEILRKKRFEKGSIDFNLPEVEIIFDKSGKVKNIAKVERNMAHIMIEEFMLLANEVVAEYLSKKGIPLLYRVHEPPNEDKLSEAAALLARFGIYVKLSSPNDIQKALDAVKNKPFEKMFNYLLLRCMKQAKYSPENIGHYALAKENYTHFTSPIRRYPDLINHRILRRAINKKVSDRYIDILNATLPETGQHCSDRERSAADAEREITDYFKVVFMEDKIGEEFRGIVTGVTSFGVFVEIEEYLVEGLVPLRNLTDDYYQYFEQEHLVRGKRRGNTYRLGDRVKVRVEKTDRINKSIDLAFVEKSDDTKRV